MQHDTIVAICASLDNPPLDAVAPDGEEDGFAAVVGAPDEEVAPTEVLVSVVDDARGGGRG